MFAEDVILENSEGPIDGVEIRKRIYSGILEGMCIFFLLCTGGPRIRLFRTKYVFFYPILLIKLFFFKNLQKCQGKEWAPYLILSFHKENYIH